MKEKHEWGLLLGLATLALAIFLIYWDVGVVDDEGYLLGGVMRILNGQVPYIDFHHTYAPGRFYLVAFLFRMFGESIVVLRGFWVILRVCIVLFAFLAGRRFLSKPAAFTVALLFLIGPGPWHKSFFHLFVLANFITLSMLNEKKGNGPPAMAGLLAGVTFLFRQDLGVIVCGIYLLFLFLGRWSGETRRRGFVFFLCLLAPVVPVALFFAVKGGFGVAAEKILFAGMRDNHTNSLPFPPLFHPVTMGPRGTGFLLLRLLYYVPVPLYAAAGVVGVARFFRGRKEGNVLILLSLLGLFTFNQTVWRSDLSHLLQSLAPFYILLLWVTDEIARRRVFLGTCLTSILPFGLYVLLMNYSQTYLEPGGPSRILAEGFQPIPPYYTGSLAQLGGGETQRLGFERAPIRTTRDQAHYLHALEEIVDRYSEPGDYILTVPGMQLIYFLMDRKNPTAYIHLRRALDSPEEEQRYIRDLLDHPTRLVLLRDSPIDGREERRFSRFARPVFEAIEREFDHVEDLGNLKVYVRRETAP